MQENKVKKIWNKYKSYFIAPTVVIIVLLLIYAIKGIYPFGSMTIAHGDVGQSYMPFYHFLYDVVYNGKNLFYDYTLGMGSNMYGRFIIDGLFNPSSWLVLLSGRENIPNMLSFVLMIKISFIALSSYILFNKLYKKNTFYNVLFSVLYAFSGYALMYNTNLMWLDVVGLFPLFILAMKYMFETNKLHWYSIILALILICNYNLAYMVVLFVMLIVPIYIKLGLPKEKRKRAILNLFLGTGLAIGLSAFAILPAFTQIMNSYRMSGSRLVPVENINLLFKSVIFIFYALPIFGFVNWFKHYKKDKTNIIMYSLALILTAIIPIFFERVNLVWHLGSYQMFPYRYGFIPVLILYLGALRYFSNFEKLDEKEQKQDKMLNILLGIVFIIITVVGFINAIHINNSLPAFIMQKSNFILILMTLVLRLIILKNFSFGNKEKLKKIVVSIIILSEVLMYVYAYVGVYPEKRYGREWSDEEIFTSYEIQDKISTEDNLYRLKDLTELTTENCSLVHNIPTIATFMHIINSDQVVNYYQMGYSASSTKLNDYGGTIFSDAVYGVKYVLSKNNLSDKIYNYIDSTKEGIKIYEYKNTLPIGITYENEVIEIPGNLVAFDAQNYLYKTMFNKDENIIEKVKVASDGNKYKIKVEEASELYLYTTSEMKKIIVNEEILILPTVNDEENTVFPTGYGNGILDLGTYENETVEIELQRNTYGSIQFGSLTLQKYYEIFDEKDNEIEVAVQENKIKITGQVEEDTKLFIPINHDKGWEIQKSNQETEIKKVYNNFIGLNIKAGLVNIDLEFVPEYFTEGVILTVIAIILLIIIPIIDNKLKICNNKIILNITLLLGFLIYIFLFTKIYVINIIQTFIYN